MPASGSVEDGVLLDDIHHLFRRRLDVREEFADVLDRAFGQIVGEAAGADVRVVHAQAGDPLEDAEDVLACAEAQRHHRCRAKLVVGGGDSDKVGGDPVELHEEDADLAGTARNLIGDAE